MNKKISRRKETFFQSIVALMFSQIIVKILGLVYKLYLTNKEGFGDEGNAITSAAFQAYSLVLSITSIGVPAAVSKLVAERSGVGDHRGAYKIFRVSLALFSIIGIIGSYMLAISAKFISNNILGMPEVELSLLALAPSIFLVSIISVYKGYFNGRQNMRVTAKAQTYDQITKTFITVVVIEISTIVSKITNMAIIVAIANLATTLANIIEFTYLYSFYRKEINNIKYEIMMSVHIKTVRTLWIVKEIIFVSIPMSITPFIGTIGRNFDSTTIISGLQTNMSYDDAKIQYGILNGKVDTLVNFPLSFSGTMSTALIPSIASANSRNTIADVENRINTSLLVGLLIALPTAAVYYFFANDILQLLFPNASSGDALLQISAFTIILLSIEQTIRGVLIGIGENKITIITAIIDVVIGLILNKTLIPLNNSIIGGINGAAIGNLVSNFVVTVIGYFCIKKKVGIKIRKKNILKAFISTLTFIFVSKIIYTVIKIGLNKKIGLVISLTLGIIIYFGLIHLFNILNTKQLQRLSFSQKKAKKEKKYNYQNA